MVTRIDYQPYGEKTVTGPNIFHQKFTGQEDDETTELMYYQSRFYDPKLGRFISADTTVPDPTYSQSFNRYMYVNGNPINFNDPTGHEGDSPSDPSSADSSDDGSDWTGWASPGGDVSFTNFGGSSSSSSSSHNSSSVQSNSSINKSNNIDGTKKSTISFSSDGENDDDEDKGDSAEKAIVKTTVNNQNNTNGGRGSNQKKLHNPLPKSAMVVWSEFGWRTEKKTGRRNYHQGIDLGAPRNTDIYAADKGFVLDIDSSPTYGNRIIIQHADGMTTEYSHCEKIIAKMNQPVNRGEVIAKSGQSGKPGTLKHLHFVVRIEEEAVNPRPYLNFD